MGTQGRRFRLGLFVLGAGALFFLLLVFILENTFSSERVAYYIVFDENVKGMVVGSKVNFQGVPVGVVCDLRFQDGKTLVELRIDPTRARLQNVTKARMDRLLVTGQVTIELEGYDESGIPLPPGSTIEPKADPLSSLRGSIPEVVVQATSVLSRLDKLLISAENVLGEDNQARVATILDNLVLASEHLRSNTLPAVDSTLAGIQKLTGEGSELVREGGEFVREGGELAKGGGELVRDARAAIAVLTRLEPQLVGLVSEVEALVREATAFTGSVRTPTQTVLATLRRTLDDVRALARQLKLAPDSLLFGIERPATPPGGHR